MHTNLSSASLRADPTARFLGVGSSTLWRWVKTKPGFPQPIRLSARCTVFRVDELIAWRDAQATKVSAR